MGQLDPSVLATQQKLLSEARKSAYRSSTGNVSSRKPPRSDWNRERRRTYGQSFSGCSEISLGSQVSVTSQRSVASTTSVASQVSKCSVTGIEEVLLEIEALINRQIGLSAATLPKWRRKLRLRRRFRLPFKGTAQLELLVETGETVQDNLQDLWSQVHGAQRTIAYTNSLPTQRSHRLHNTLLRFLESIQQSCSAYSKVQNGKLKDKEAVKPMQRFASALDEHIRSFRNITKIVHVHDEQAKKMKRS
ncbi:hypothetical protein QBC44DRAFT_377406 [Cladorrhinum sp. PSN332]|nr:hypothetical protein QBC44DRAFT_377406 [Cladorrhinum sp. PSN332]